MNKRKGMSQTLALIVAASVLMMTALTVIFLARGSLGELGQTSGKQACTNAIESQCAATSASSIDTPGVCITQDADGNPSVRQDVQNWDDNREYAVEEDTTDCPDTTTP